MNKYWIMQRVGRLSNENIKLVNVFDSFDKCFDKLISYGVPLGDPRNQLVEYFIVVVDSNDKYVGFLTGEEAIQKANYLKIKEGVQ